MVNVGKYTSPMDAMGYEPLFAEIARSQESNWKKIHCYPGLVGDFTKISKGCRRPVEINDSNG